MSEDMLANSTTEMKNQDEEFHTFSDLKVSTTTVTSNFPHAVNIIDLAKYLPLDNVVVGIKLVYAGGTYSVIRGVAKISKKAKDFYNQVTFTVRLPMNGESSLQLASTDASEILKMAQNSILVSCKIFHNGTLHITGTHDLDEATMASNLLRERLLKFSGYKIVSIVENVPFLTSFDNLLHSSNGDTIGWVNLDKNIIHMKNEYVYLDVMSTEVTQIIGYLFLVNGTLTMRNVFIP